MQSDSILQPADLQGLLSIRVRPEWNKTTESEILLQNYNGIWAGSLGGEIVPPSEEEIAEATKLFSSIVDTKFQYQHYRHTGEENWYRYQPLAAAIIQQPNTTPVICVVYQSTKGGTIWLRALRETDAHTIKITEGDEEPTPWNGIQENGQPKFTCVGS